MMTQGIKRFNHANLYEQDYHLWLETAVKLLRQQRFTELDLENLVEEIEGLTKSQRRELRNRLTVLLEHWLKLTYWQQEKERCEKGWKNTIREQSRQITLLLQDSPSLMPFLSEILENCYIDAREDAIFNTELPSAIFPEQSPLSLKEILSLKI